MYARVKTEPNWVLRFLLHLSRLISAIFVVIRGDMEAANQQTPLYIYHAYY